MMTNITDCYLAWQAGKGCYGVNEIAALRSQ